MNARKLGWLPDLPKLPGEKPDHDARDVLKAAPVPAAKNLSNLILSILDQGSLGSCVGNAIAQALRASMVFHGAKSPELASRLFLYWFSRAYHHQTNEDAGTYLRMCFSAASKFGFPPESSWTYDDGPSKFKLMPSMKATHDAYDQRSPTIYRKITATGQGRIDAIKAAIAQSYLVTFGTEVSVAFARNDLGITPLQPPIGLEIAGGHAMCIAGYDGDVFQIVNSWSKDFGDAGWCRFSADYIKWSKTNDLWIVENAGSKFSSVTA